MIEIILTHRKPRDEERQIAFFTIDDIEFSCGNVPASLTTQASIKTYLESRADEFRLLLLRKQYPESDLTGFKTEENTELEAMEDWISKGHKNKIIIGLDDKEKPVYEDQIIDKKELEYKHPKEIGLNAKIDASSLSKELKDLLKEIIEK